MAAAVASLPRVPAPKGLVDRVMAELRHVAPVEHPARPFPPLVLRPWEMGWLGAICLLLVVGISMLMGGWELSGWAALGASLLVWLESVKVSVHGLMVSVSQWPADLTGMRSVLHDTADFWSGKAFSWLLGATGFAIALGWLLSRPGPSGARGEWEDAHV
jgi:hypothetical protein